MAQYMRTNGTMHALVFAVRKARKTGRQSARRDRANRASAALEYEEREDASSREGTVRALFQVLSRVWAIFQEFRTEQAILRRDNVSRICRREMLSCNLTGQSTQETELLTPSVRSVAGGQDTAQHKAQFYCVRE